MLLSIYSWDGHLINDTTNYVSWFPRGAKRMPNASPVWAARSQTFPKLANKMIDGGMITFAIECKGTFHSQEETLKQWFKVDDYTERRLIVKDTADSNRQWYVEGYPSEPVMAEGHGVSVFLITLALAEPLWRTVTEQTDAWGITASGQTRVLSVLGNHNARPILTITPTAAKTGGYTYAKWMPWYNPMYPNSEPLELTNGGLNTAALIANNSNKCQVNQVGGITAAATTIPYDTVTGSIPAAGTIYCDTEQMSYTGKTGTDLTGVTRGVNGTTAATHADNAVIYVSKMKANGDDLRVFMDGVQVDRWISGINTAATKIWINQISTEGVKASLVLATAIASSGSVTTLTVSEADKTTKWHLSRLPKSFIFFIGNEVFTGRNANSRTLSFTVTGRAAKNTSMEAHAIGDVITWIEHDIYLVYGNASAGAPATNDAKKPMINLSSSTNVSWVWDEFASGDGLRTAAWKRFGAASGIKLSETYSGPHGVQADPATEAGIALKAYQSNGAWMADSQSMMWTIEHYASFTAITVTGEKYRYTADWPTFKVTTPILRAGHAVVFTEATPSAAQTWQALSTHSAVALPFYTGVLYPPFVRFELVGTVSGAANNMAAMEMQSVTLAIKSAWVMQLFGGSVVEHNNYQIDCFIANSATGDSISLFLPMELNKVLVIDCDAETVVYDGKDIGVPLGWNTVRGAWLDLQPGNNTLTFTDTGATPGLTMETRWEDRNTL